MTWTLYELACLEIRFYTNSGSSGSNGNVEQDRHVWLYSLIVNLQSTSMFHST